MKKLFFFMLITWLMFSQKAFSEQQAIDHALQHNVSFQRAKLVLTYTDKEIWQGYLTYVPTVTFNHSLIHYSDKYLEQLKAMEDGIKQLIPPEYAANIPSTAFQNVYRSNLTMNWTLFANGQALNWLQSKQKQKDVQDIELAEQKQDLMFQVRQTYSSLFIAEEAVKLHEKRVETSKKRLTTIKQMLENGLVNQVEYKRWELQVTQAESGLLTAEHQRDIARMQFSYTIGAGIQDRFILLYSPQESVSEFSEYTEDYLNQFDLKKLSPIKKAVLNNRRLETSKLLNYGKFLPRLNAGYTYNWQQDKDMFNSNTTWEASLNFSWDLFNGFKDILDVQKAEIERFQSELDVTDAKRQIELMFTQLFYAFEQAQKQHSTATKSLEIANEMHRIMDLRFQKKLVTNLDFLDSESQLHEAELNQLLSFQKLVLAGFSIKKQIEQ